MNAQCENENSITANTLQKSISLIRQNAIPIKHICVN